MSIFLILFYILFPALVITAEGRYPFVKKVGAVVICYIAGLILGNIGILPEGFGKTQDLINTIIIPLAIPLLLFSMNIRKWFSMARATFLSLILGIVSALTMIFLGFFLFRDQIPEIDKVAGMLTGIYTGGTPNLASIKIALNVDPNTYIQTHTYDLFIGAVLLLFLITIAQRFFLLFLRPWHISDTSDHGGEASQEDEFSSYEGILKKKTLLPLLAGVGIAVLIFGIAGAISMLLPENTQMAVVILGITTLGILASLIPRIHAIRKTFQTGMYLILVFCVVVSSMADLRMLLDIQWPLFWYVMIATIGALFFHGFLSWVFKVDADNMIIASTALSMAPPFVPVVAAALKNKEIIISGIMIGVIGYAIGNYFGVTIGLSLGRFL